MQWAGNTGLGLTVERYLRPGHRLPHLEESTSTLSISPFRIRFLDIVCNIDLSVYSLITSPVRSIGASNFLLGPMVLINSSCSVCQNIVVKSDIKTLINHQTDYIKNFTIKKNVENGEQLLFEYSQDVEDIVKDDDDFKFTCIN